MKVLFDHQIFTIQEFGGISRYYFELTKELNKISNVSTKCGLIFSNNEYIEGNEYFKHKQFFKKNSFKGKARIMFELNDYYSKYLMRRNDFDVFHPTYYGTYYLGVPLKKPLIITCLDLIHEKFIQTEREFLLRKMQILNRADKILAISQSTKNDLMEFYGIEDSKIAITYLASSFIKKKTDSCVNFQEKQFFLYVGNRNLYKNFISYVTAIAPLIKYNKDLYLFCAGGGGFNYEEKAVFQELGIANKIEHHSGSDEKLEELYSSAIAFFYPSLYEGFGIPLLEAMNCGCPVVSSNTSSLPEVAGEAAIYFDPNNQDEIFDRAKEIYSNEFLRQDLRRKGFVRAEQFSWKETAHQTLQIYNSMV